MTTITTGLDMLDRKLGGGIPAGSIVALCAPPGSNAELFLYEFTAPRETLYLTLDRSELAVADSLRRTPVHTGSPMIQYVEDDVGAEHAIELVRDLPEEATPIVDPHTPLETMERQHSQAPAEASTISCRKWKACSYRCEVEYLNVPAAHEWGVTQ